ncbi:MAG: NAD-dependent epimerase/dehydratase family protein [Planctomycetota bacterium]
MRILVTGGTGLLGNNILRLLSERSGERHIALVRQQPDSEVFAGFNVETVVDDLEPNTTGDHAEAAEQTTSEQTAEQTTSEQATTEQTDGNNGHHELEEAVEACDAVIHAAGFIHLGWRHQEKSMRVNRDGTARIADACLKHSKRMIYIGTVNTLAVGSPQTLADEDTPLGHAGGQVQCAYVASKRAAVDEVLKRIERGLEGVILHPAFMLGPWDWKPSSGRMILELGSGWKPISPRGGCSLCDVRDVAAATINAVHLEAFRRTQYVLAGHNWTYHRLWSEMAMRMNRRPPIRPTGPGAEYLAGLAGDLWAKITGREGDLNSAGAAMSGQFHWYDSSRAVKDLGYQVRDAQTILDDAAAWIHSRFVLPKERESR